MISLREPGMSKGFLLQSYSRNGIETIYPAGSGGVWILRVYILKHEQFLDFMHGPRRLGVIWSTLRDRSLESYLPRSLHYPAVSTNDVR